VPQLFKLLQQKLLLITKNFWPTKTFPSLPKISDQQKRSLHYQKFSTIQKSTHHNVRHESKCVATKENNDQCNQNSGCLPLFGVGRFFGHEDHLMFC
jgi:hypothetical protein